MKLVSRHMTTGAAAAAVACLVLAEGLGLAGARVNLSRSIPPGLYWTSTAPIAKGAYVLLCPQPLGVFDDARSRGYIGAGFCPGGYGFMMKRISATQGDVVSAGDDGVRVNGVLLPLSAPVKTDKAGRPLQRYQADRHGLGDHEALLMSDADASGFDGRYFGPVDVSQIRTVLRPVITW